MVRKPAAFVASPSLRIVPLVLLVGCNPCCDSSPNRPAYCKDIPPDEPDEEPGELRCAGPVWPGGAPPIREPADEICNDKAARAENGAPFDTTVRVPLDAVVTKSNGVAIVSEKAVEDDIKFINRYFTSVNIEFFKNSYIVSDTIPPKVDYSVAPDPIFTRRDAVPVLYVQTLLDEKGNEIGGVSWGNGNGVIVWSTSGTHNPILAHELGHTLGLEHTHLCDDGIDDTPPDPGPDNVDCATGASQGTCVLDPACAEPACNACEVTCTAPNANAKPDGRNLMSPYWGPCRRFTPGQEEMMRCKLRTGQKRLASNLCDRGAVFDGSQVAENTCGQVDGKTFRIFTPGSCTQGVEHYAASQVTRLAPGNYRATVDLACGMGPGGPSMIQVSACVLQVFAESTADGTSWTPLGTPVQATLGGNQARQSITVDFSLGDCSKTRLNVQRLTPPAPPPPIREIIIEGWKIEQLGV